MESQYSLVSIVTVVYNGFTDIEATINSVLNQSYPAIQYIIIDGGSTDGTLSIIEKYRSQIDIIISEQDQGIYDAMNKAIEYCAGAWINFMNCGDFFYSTETIAGIFNEEMFDLPDLIYGNHKALQRGNLISKIPAPLEDLWKGMTIQHQSTFIKTSILKESPFNIKYLYAADYDVFYKNLKKGVKIKYINKYLSIVTAEGFSETNSVATYLEFWQIASKYEQNSLLIEKHYRWVIKNRKFVSLIKKTFPFLNRLRSKFRGNAQQY